MPIYAYKCESCGHAKDVLQRMSDPLLTDCPACGAPAFKKQVTAAGFQLKGSGWYATDFKGGGAAPVAPTGDKSDTGGDSKSEPKGDSKGDSRGDSKADAKPDSKAGDTKTESRPAAPAPTGAISKPANKPAGGGASAGTGAD
jgi:putative FmdB family regulatory protein